MNLNLIPKTKVYWFIITFLFIYFTNAHLYAQQRHIYIANDNHTDYFWAGNADDYKTVGLDEIDYYMNLSDATASLPAPYQDRYNLDGAWYVYNYKKYKTPAEFQRLIDHIKSGHMSMPFNYFVSTYGGQPTEAVLRGMYWAGKLDRDYDLNIKLAVSMENQTQPLGLSSLWAGAGAKYSWKGVCACTSPVSLDLLKKRNHEIYKYQGLDSTSVIMKWYSFTYGSNLLGGYAEARRTSDRVEQSDEFCNTPTYPYNVVGAFGAGWDDLGWITDVFSSVAQTTSNADRQVIVSNEHDFFEDFEAKYGNNLPSETITYGNDWDVNCATLAPITAKIRNSVEKLRSAEALASVASLVNPNFYSPVDPRREKAWIALGSYWEHNFGLGGCCYDLRNDWEIGLQKDVTNYTDSLYQVSLDAIASNIPQPSTNQRFFIFNALNWERTDFADIAYNGDANIKVIDVQSQQEVPHQIITSNNVKYLRILAKNIPSVGYKVFEIQAGTGATLPNAATQNGSVFENQFYKLTVTPGGAITSLIDKTNGNQEFVKVTNGRYANDFGQGNSQSGTLALVNNGPVSATISCTSSNPLSHITYITLYKDINRIDIKNVINQEYGDAIRTYSFSFDLSNPTLRHEELGAILKAKYSTHGGNYATPDQPIRHAWQTLNHFGDIGSDTKGITLSNEGAAFMKLGNSNDTFLDENSAQINVLIGGVMWNLNNDYVSNQYGLKEFINSFALRTRTQKFDAASAMRFALEHQNPFAATMVKPETSTAGNSCRTLPQSQFSLLKISEPKVVLWALKPSEEGMSNGGLIARVWNLDTLNHQTTLDFVSDAQNAFRTTHLETNIESASVAQGNLTAPIGQQRMETFRVFLRPYVAENNANSTTVNATICKGQQYEGYTQSGTYTDIYSKPTGCDSVRILHLTVIVADTVRLQQFTCDPAQVGQLIQKLTNQNGCDSIVIKTTSLTPLDYQIQQKDASCSGINDGQIIIQSANNYTYQWSDGTSGTQRNNLAAGTYLLTVTNPQNECFNTDTITIQNASSLNLKMVGQDNYCVNGFVTTIVTGGYPPYTYKWDTQDTTQSVLGIDAGTYSVTVTDNVGCKSQGTIDIKNYDQVNITVTKKDISCFGAQDGSIALNINGGVLPYAITWSNGGTGLTQINLAPGTYTIMFADSAGCNISKNVMIRTPLELAVNVDVKQASAANANDGGATATPSGGRTPYTVTWSNGARGNKIDGMPPGSYSVMVADSSGCTASKSFTIDVLSDLQSISSLQSFNLYPNPATERLQLAIQFNQAEHGIIIFQDMMGKEIKRESFYGDSFNSEIALDKFATGVYNVRLIVGNKEITKQIIIQ